MNAGPGVKADVTTGLTTAVANAAVWKNFMMGFVWTSLSRQLGLMKAVGDGEGCVVRWGFR